MGTEAVWVPIVLAAASTAATVANTRSTARKQDNIAAEGIRKQAKTQSDANARLNRTLQAAQESNPDDVQKKAQEQYMAAIRRQQGQATKGLKASGIGSADYSESAGKAANDSVDYASTIGNLMSRIDAGAAQRLNEQFSYGNLGMDLDVLNRNVGQDDFLTRLRLQGVRRNPWLDAGAAAASGYAGSYGGGG